MSNVMKIKDLSAVFHTPRKLTPIIKNDKEVAQQLPMCKPVEAYAVDEYPACPKSWMNGSDIASSYFLPVEEGDGLWLDFNKCFDHYHDVAVVISVQGINPITGQKTDKLRLEQYKKNCPIHNIPFQQDRFCPKCKFKWPSQNYITASATPEGYLWIDGFRNPDGTVRQYVFTEEELKGIAQQLIGDDKVYAIGIAFYISKKKKERKDSEKDIKEMLEDVKNGRGMVSNMFFSPYHTPQNWNVSSLRSGGTVSDNDNYDSCQIDVSYRSDEKTCGNLDLSYGGTLISSDINDRTFYQLGPKIEDDGDPTVERYYELNKGKIEVKSVKIEVEEPKVVEESSVEEVEPVKKLEIAAGALIKQKIHEDLNEMDYWQDKPYGMIYINYCDKETVKNIVSQGKRKEKKEGYMEGLKLSN